MLVGEALAVRMKSGLLTGERVEAPRRGEGGAEVVQGGEMHLTTRRGGEQGKEVAGVAREARKGQPEAGGSEAPQRAGRVGPLSGSRDCAQTEPSPRVIEKPDRQMSREPLTPRRTRRAAASATAREVGERGPCPRSWSRPRSLPLESDG